MFKFFRGDDVTWLRHGVLVKGRITEILPDARMLVCYNTGYFRISMRDVKYVNDNPVTAGFIDEAIVRSRVTVTSYIKNGVEVTVCRACQSGPCRCAELAAMRDDCMYDYWDYCGDPEELAEWDMYVDAFIDREEAKYTDLRIKYRPSGKYWKHQPRRSKPVASPCK
jgi:hypothetical protein